MSHSLSQGHQKRNMAYWQSATVLILQILIRTSLSQHLDYNQIMKNVQRIISKIPENGHQEAQFLTPGDNVYTERATQRAADILTPLKDRDFFGNQTVSSKCVDQTALYLESLLKNETWALRMVDAMGKLPSALMNGIIQWPGSYDECVNITTHVDLQWSNRSTFEDIQGRYCRVGIPLANVTQQDVIVASDFSAGSLVIGLCVPDTCSESDVLNLIREGLSLIPISSFPEASKVVCQDGTIEYTTGAIVVIVVLSLLGSVLFLGTAYDVIFIQSNFDSRDYISSKKNNLSVTDDMADGGPNEEIHYKIPDEQTSLLGNKVPAETKYQPGYCGRILLAFSVYTNASKILNTKQSAGSIRALNGIRVMSMTWVLLGHSYSFGITITENVLPYFMVQFKRWTFQALLNATVSVDTFFTISGLLLSYLVLKEMKQNNGKLNWFMFYFHRFWRLTPCYMLVIMTYSTLFQYWGSGPFWPETGIDPNCRDYWWTNLLYINNFFDMTKMCMGWSWYLSNDMQFYVISPLMFVPLYFSGLIGVAVSSVFLLATFITSGVIASYYNLPPNIIGGGGEANGMLHFFDDYYVKPYCRIGPYVIGILTGYILYKTECKVKMSRVLNLLGWAIATASALAVLYGLSDTLTGKPLSNDVSAFYNAVNRTVWGMAVCWVVFACATGHGGFVNTILSWEAWVPIGRLTYCGYLIHPVIILGYYYQRQHLYYISTLEAVYTYFGNLVATYAIAFMVSLAFEAPWMGLEKVIFGRDRRS